MVDSSFDFWNFLNFFSSIFNPWLVEPVDAKVRQYCRCWQASQPPAPLPSSNSSVYKPLKNQAPCRGGFQLSREEQQDQEARQQQQELGLSLIPAEGQKRRFPYGVAQDVDLSSFLSFTLWSENQEGRLCCC